MQLSALLQPAHAPAAPIYVYMNSGSRTLSQVSRLVPLRAEEVCCHRLAATPTDMSFQPFHGLVGQYLFIGYAAHDYQLSPIYWPEHYCNLTDPSHEIIQHVGLLLHVNSPVQDSIYEIEHGGAVFLQEVNTRFCGASPYRLLCPMWSLDELHGISFHPATFPKGFPPPALPAPSDLLVPLSWQDLDLRSSSSFSNSPYHQPNDFDHEVMTIDPTTTTTTTTTTSADFVHAPVSEDSGQFNAMIALDHHHLRHKKLLKTALATSLWGHPIKLGKMLYAGHLLVGLPVNPFAIHEVDSRWLITTSFLKALHLNTQTYEQLHDVPLTVVDEAGNKTAVGWSYLCERFLDFFIDFTSKLRKVIKGSMTPDAGFASNADHQASKSLHLIDLFNSNNQEMIQEAITHLIETQGFKEVLWSSLFRPIVALTEGQARLADLYPEAIQTLTGFLGKGIVGVLITLIYQAFTLPLPADMKYPRLKSFDMYPIIMFTLDNMYAHPDHFPTFFMVAEKLPYLHYNYEQLRQQGSDPKGNAGCILRFCLFQIQERTLTGLTNIDCTTTPSVLSLTSLTITYLISRQALSIVVWTQGSRHFKSTIDMSNRQSDTFLYHKSCSHVAAPEISNAKVSPFHDNIMQLLYLSVVNIASGPHKVQHQ
ncbi:hypothetical protein EDD22DRAFT_854110 [Suillus occidentalis]|nr:hypothetical protein EDD22DRAFT_854110 [Suillus occidentalis]